MRSNLARGDLAARLARLAVPREVIPRLVLFLEEEVERALEAARRDDAFTAEEVEAAAGSGDVVEKLRRARAERARVDAIRRAGLHELSRDELEALVADARGARS